MCILPRTWLLLRSRSQEFLLDQFTFDQMHDPASLQRMFERVTDRLSQDLNPAVIRRFIQPLRIDRVDGDTVILRAPGQFVKEYIVVKHQEMLARILSDELGQEVRLEVVSEGNERVRAKQPTVAIVSTDNGPNARSFAPNSKYNFDQFVVGESNRFAYGGAKAVANSPGKTYNPLFIYGPSGLGKTHLLHAIASQILANQPGYSMAYVTGQQFAEDFVSALQSGKVEAFRRAHRNVNLWLVDDVQFIAGKEKTQEEFFHTFNFLMNSDKQLVFCADRPPRDLRLTDERLRSRFESGLVADVSLPDTETRAAILQAKAVQMQVDLPTDVAMFIAKSIAGNVRLLEGALTKLAALGSLTGQILTVEFAAEQIEKYYSSVGSPRPAFDMIVETVSRHYKIPADEIRGTCRKAPIAHARHVAVFVTRELTGDSWKHIGSLFGGRDHTSMMHAYQKIRDMMKTDRDTYASIKAVMQELNPDYS